MLTVALNVIGADTPVEMMRYCEPLVYRRETWARPRIACRTAIRCDD